MIGVARVVELLEDTEATARDAEVLARRAGDGAEGTVQARIAAALRELTGEIRAVRDRLTQVDYTALPPGRYRITFDGDYIGEGDPWASLGFRAHSALFPAHLINVPVDTPGLTVEAVTD